MNMIEKVAEAINNEGKLIGNEADVGDIITVDDACKRLAKAAFLAMRDYPHRLFNKTDIADEIEACNCWEQMIDAALKEE